MAGERTYPILPCPDLDEALAFYAMLGFTTTYKQQRPNPYAVVTREDFQIHLSAIDGFDPTQSYASVIVTAPDISVLYDAFAAGLKTGLGRVPRAGIPRLLRIREKSGTATGFSVVDPGGNWLRFYREGSSEEPDPDQSKLRRVIATAARQGDARGNDATALAVLDRGLARYHDADADDIADALAYREELLERLGGPET